MNFYIGGMIQQASRRGRVIENVHTGIQKEEMSIGITQNLLLLTLRGNAQFTTQQIMRLTGIAITWKLATLCF